MSWELVYTKQAQKDAKKLNQSNLREKAQALLDFIKINPFQNPPPYEKLVGDLSGAYSRRINVQHRIVYEVIESANTVKILRMWTHFEVIKTGKDTKLLCPYTAITLRLLTPTLIHHITVHPHQPTESVAQEEPVDK
ncbi:MAG TPA: Txe/YoeB family addiction module toxin [Cyanobacteria bacterium UBA11159]|nr:Txe/YoeB family addiction module toxin [Cyanobacteria bacterium UBA11367]HBK62210.1 Txe/YoeB family addiction module toxin [Cyanobacteria bacterium UBA11166]HBR76433.1 Txe/YoeB family addiction module toxin [Cyanobacteria bacterium UBA11159]HCA96367.1 Txe/YoeB family addiction module toxin [Cyanobacteria bacterium UBA9226]